MGCQPGRYAAMDIGTVTCRMLVADVSADGSVHELEKRYAITNLGEGTDASGRLSEAAMDRVTCTIADYCESRNALALPDSPIVTRCVATSAARDASNSNQLAEKLAALGVKLEVIAGQTEADLSFLGAGSDYRGETVMVVDVGGGSTETVVGVAGNPPAAAHSFDVGSRRVTERFLHDDPPSTSQLQEARRWIRTQLEAYLPALAEEALASYALTSLDRLVFVAGAATTVVSIREAMAVYDSSRVNGAQVTIEELDAIEGRLAALPVARRAETVGLDPGRAPVIVGGLLVIGEVLRVMGAERFTVSENDILRGIILDAAAG